MKNSSFKTSLKRFFPIISWLPFYEKDWIISDLAAGVTVGMLSVPNSMAFAKLVGVPIEHGLYSSFVGVIIYQLFATSKDVTIGTTVVLSLLTAQSTAQNKPAEMNIVEFVAAVSFLTGMIQIVIGICKLGFIFDFISL